MDGKGRVATKTLGVIKRDLKEGFGITGVDRYELVRW